MDAVKCCYIRCSKPVVNKTFYCKIHMPSKSQCNIERDNVMCRLVIRKCKFIIDNVKNLKVVGRYETARFGEFLELRQEDKNLCKHLKLKYQE